MGKKTRKPRTKGEAILHKARMEPSPTCDDPNQITIFDYEKSRAFSALDAAIEDALKRGAREMRIGGFKRPDGTFYEVEAPGLDAAELQAESFVLLEAFSTGGQDAYDAALKQCPLHRRFNALMRDDPPGSKLN